jgi:hypothetical protein
MKWDEELEIWTNLQEGSDNLQFNNRFILKATDGGSQNFSKILSWDWRVQTV